MRSRFDGIDFTEVVFYSATCRLFVGGSNFCLWKCRARGAKLQNSTQKLPAPALAPNILMACEQLRTPGKVQHLTLNPSNSCHRVIFRIALKFVPIAPGAPTN